MLLHSPPTETSCAKLLCSVSPLAAPLRRVQFCAKIPGSTTGVSGTAFTPAAPSKHLPPPQQSWTYSPEMRSVSTQGFCPPS